MKVRGHVHGTKGSKTVYREEYIDTLGLYDKLSVDAQKAIEKCIEYGARKITILLEEPTQDTSETRSQEEKP